MTILYSTLVLLVLALVFGVTLAVLGKNLPYTRTNASNKCVKTLGRKLRRMRIRRLRRFAKLS